MIAMNGEYGNCNIDILVFIVDMVESTDQHQPALPDSAICEMDLQYP